jgi:hypothetical protein
MQELVQQVKYTLAQPDCTLDHRWASIVIKLVTALEFAQADVAAWRGATELLRLEITLAANPKSKRKWWRHDRAV